MAMSEQPNDLPPPGEPARSLRLSIYEGGAYTLMIAVTISFVRTAFAASLGATDAEFSALTALATLATLGAVVSAQLIGRVGSRKRLIMRFVWSRAAWALLALVPFVSLPPHAALYALMALVLVITIFDAMTGNAWMSWMTDLVPAERRSRYFGRRAAIHAAVAIAASWAVGHAYDFFRDPARLGAQRVFAPLWLFAGAAGALSALVMGRKWEPPLHGETTLPVGRMLRLPFANRNFRRLILFYILWTLVTAVSTPFWQPHMINNLNMDGATIAMYSILAGAVGLLTQPLWGRVIDRFGSRPALVICIAGISFLPLFWLFARPDFLWAIWADATLTGLLWPGFNLASFSMNLQSAPRENRQAYFAALTVVVGVTGFLANLLGGWIAVAGADFHAVFLGFPLVNYHLIFVLSAAGRLAMLPFARRLHEERSHPAGVVIAVATQKLATVLGESLQSGVELVRRIARP